MRVLFLWFFFIHLVGFAKSTNFEIVNGEKDPLEQEEFPPPWFTGPLLTPSGHVVPAGFVNFEPYVYVNITNGQYDSHWHSFSVPKFYNVNFQLPLYVGLTKWMDILIVPAASWNETEHVTSLEVNDFPIALDFQLLEDTETNKLPGIKVYIQETFPIGHYQKRKPEKKGTDIGGEGSFITTLGFVITRTFHIYQKHYLAMRLNGLYNIPTSVHVRGLNNYGGAPDTNAKVKVGQSFEILYGLEYSLTQNWALAIDLFGNYKFKTTFSGNPGTIADGTPATLGNPSSFQFSLAPAIEYNFNDSVGLIGGAWFTVAGRNASRFISAVFAINYFGPEITKRRQYRTSGGGGG